MHGVDVISYATFVPDEYDCKRLIEVRRRGGGLGWASYVQAALKAYNNSDFNFNNVFLPIHCGGFSEYSVVYPGFNVKLNIIEYKVKKFKNITFNSNIDKIIEYIRMFDSVIIYMHNLFSISFIYDLIRLIPKVRRLSNVEGIIAHQHAAPPPREYTEVYSALPFKISSGLLDAVSRKYLKYIDGFIVNNRRTYDYLVTENGFNYSRVVFQHVGIDYESVNPSVYKNEEFWDGCEHRLVMVSRITLKHGGYAKGVDLIPDIVAGLRRLGYRSCIAVIGSIYDRDLADRLRNSGVILTGSLPRDRLFSILASADLYILPARRSYYYGGVGVATIEAMALDKPVISPVLEHVPRQNIINKLGIKTPWIDKDKINEYSRYIAEALGSKFQPRVYSKPIYDARVMAENIVKVMKNIINE